MDDNTKYSIKEYREALYKEIANQKYQKKPERIGITLLAPKDTNCPKNKEESSC